MLILERVSRREDSLSQKIRKSAPGLECLGPPGGALETPGELTAPHSPGVVPIFPPPPPPPHDIDGLLDRHHLLLANVDITRLEERPDVGRGAVLQNVHVPV